MRLTSTLVFLTMTVVGVLVAYDQPLAIRRFGLIALGLGLVVLLAWLGARDGATEKIGFAAYGCLWLAGGIAMLYLTNVEFHSGELAPETGLLQPAAPLASIALNNATAGVLAILIPIGAASLDWLWQRRKVGERWFQTSTVLACLGLIPVFVALWALMATDSRGAWFALGVGTVCAVYFAWRFGAGRLAPLRWVGDGFWAFAVLLLIAGTLFAVFSPTAIEVVRNLTQDASARSRVQLWHDMSSIIQDYRFTGSGLGSMAMVYSTYVLLLHVVYLQHAHQLYLQIAVEQGLPGLVAFLWMIATAAWALFLVFRNNRERDSLAIGVTASLVALMVHGLFDSEVYASGLVLFIFVPIGFAWALQNANFNSDSSRTGRRVSGVRSWGLALAPLVTVVALFLVPGTGAALQANWGAVSQTQAELSVYSWPAWPIQDELRRSSEIDLRTAMERYRSALRLDPYNVSAHRRLGQIYLSQGNYGAAQENLESAHILAADERATRKLLGEVYAVTGEIDRAQEMWKTCDESFDELNLRLWWYEHLGADLEKQRIRTVIALLN